MNRVVLVASMALAGCSFQPAAATIGGDGPLAHDARDKDSAIDSPPDAFDPKCFGSGAFYVCVASVHSGTQSMPGTVDTTTCNFQGAQIAMLGSTSVCAFAADAIAVGNVDVIGNRPLVIAATGDINETGYVNASSAMGQGDGPGANDPSCSTTNGGANSNGGGGGGAGGSFGARGANGASGANGGATGGTAGQAVMAPIDKLRGGCPGGAGGTGAAGSRLADGGAGGGAIYLVARGTIHLDGTIDASGAGGTAGTQAKGGAGGGGSGGMIVFHGVVQATANAVVFANGGGGGGGAGQQADGNPGADASAFDAAALGGAGGGAGISAGGNGGFATTAATKPANAGNGGGGGGGGVGVVRLLGGAQLTNARVSPPPS